MPLIPPPSKESRVVFFIFLLLFCYSKNRNGRRQNLTYFIIYIKLFFKNHISIFISFQLRKRSPTCFYQAFFNWKAFLLKMRKIFKMSSSFHPNPNHVLRKFSHIHTNRRHHHCPSLLPCPNLQFFH